MLKLLNNIPDKIFTRLLSGPRTEHQHCFKQQPVLSAAVADHNYRRGLSQYVLVACFIVAGALPVLAPAQDTEIYVGQTSIAKHNVLFIADLSNSMNRQVPGSNRSAVDTLRETFIDLIRGLDNLQVGLMRLNGINFRPGDYIGVGNHGCMNATTAIEDDSVFDYSISAINSTFCLSEPGGTVLYPVTDLDDPVPAEDVFFNVSVASGDDNEYIAAYGGGIDAQDDELNLGQHYIFLRFDNVLVPQGAEIISAYVDFIAVESADPNNPHPRAANNLAPVGGATIPIQAQYTDDSTRIVDPPTLGSRQYTGTTTPEIIIQWGGGDPIGNWEEGTRYTTPDIKELIEFVIERPGWCGGNALTVYFLPNVNISRYAQSFQSDPAAAPVLRINYRSNYDAGETGCIVSEFNIPVAGGNSDAIARQSRQFRTVTFLPTSDFGAVPDFFTGIPVVQPNYYGVQFSLPISQGTTIESAILEIRLDDDDPGTAGPTPTSMSVSLEKNLTPPPFVVGQLNELVNRSSPSSVMNVNNAPSWDDLEDYSVDVTTVLNQQVADANWQANNPVSFIVSATPPSGSVRRIANFEGGPNHAARLRVSTRQNVADDAADLVVRDALIEIVRGFNAAAVMYQTPTVGTLYEAALYWRGKDVTYGSRRGTALLGEQQFGTNLRTDVPPNTPFRLDYTENMHRTLTSHPDSWQGGSYVSPTGQIADNSCQRAYTPECAKDKITDATYISPMDDSDEECAANFQILMTDGVPTVPVEEPFFGTIKQEFALDSCSEDPDVNELREFGRCAVEMVRNMHTNDQNSAISGSQTVTTHVILFAGQSLLPSIIVDGNSVLVDGTKWLEQVASAGGGNFYDVDTAQELQDTLEELLDIILIIPSTFTAPSISANAFNRLFSRDEIYFGLFEAAATAAWDGNVKKYNVCVHSDPDGDGNLDCELGGILDTNNMKAVTTDDTGNESFVPTSTSVWSDEQDGGQLRVGGAGGEISNINERTIYTDEDKDGQTTTAPLNTAGYELKSGDWDNSNLEHIHEEVCPAPSNSDLSAGSECEQRMLWLLGQDVLDEDGDNDRTDLRWWFADVLHSSPVAITYGLDVDDPADPADDKFIDRILVGTNEGGLHMINGYNGKEEWTFIPVELFRNFRTLYDNLEPDHVYGMDLTAAVRLIDNNNDGIIDPDQSQGDKVHVYLGMRRGGSSYYALDITPASKLTSVTTGSVIPKLLWRIKRDDVDPDTATLENDFSRLGQTWSEPVLADILCKTDTANCPDGNKTVLIFGGGYDELLDEIFAADVIPNAGNAIYVVDADTGKIIIWISHAQKTDGTDTIVNESAADIKVPEMLYSIMSQLTVIDSDGDGFDDRIYVGDAGGQVWRVDLGSDIEVGSGIAGREGSTVVGRLANISVPANVADQRRFHYRPAFAQVRDNDYSYSYTKEYDYVVISSGDRANPLGTEVRDRLYAFRDLHTGEMTEDTNHPEQLGGLAKDYPSAQPGGATTGNAITEDEMVDVTAVPVQQFDYNTSTRLGWYYSFDDGTGDERTGQKGLSAPIIIAGTVLLSSYVPPTEEQEEGVDACTVSQGTGVAHNFSILNAAATQNWEDPHADPDPVNSRSSNLGGGIPSEVVPIFTREGVTLSVGTAQGPENLGTITGLPRFRTYWNEQESSATWEP